MIVRNKIWERPIQLICPLEIRSKMTPANKAHPEALVTRPKRLARMDVSKKITSIAEDEECF